MSLGRRRRPGRRRLGPGEAMWEWMGRGLDRVLGRMERAVHRW